MKDYKIFIFSIYNDKESEWTIAQVYASNIYNAFLSLQLIYSGSKWDIDYMNQEYTCLPIEWGEFTNQISLNN